MPAAKKPAKRAYDPAGQASRYAASEQELRKAGGRRINVRLGPAAVRDLESIMALHDFPEIKQAIEWSLSMAPKK